MKCDFARLVDELFVLVYIRRSEVDDNIDNEYDVHASIDYAQEVKTEQELVEK